jgi:hypothetical protein
VITNEKNPVEWSAVRQAGDDEVKTPATSLKAIGMLRYSKEIAARRMQPAGHFAPEMIKPPVELELISNAKMLRQVQKNFLGIPHVHTETKEVIFGGGYPDLVCDDGYLRCFISMTKETGRWSASSPNLHNSPNKQEGPYKKIMGKRYPGYIRTMFQAPPGYLIVESDYASAELFLLAMASGDMNLWDHCSRNLLPEEDPRFIDPHSNLCVQAFHFQCTPNKSGLERLGKGYMRNVAKCVADSEFVWTDYGPYRVRDLMFDHNSDIRQFTGSENYNYRVMGLDEHLPLVAGMYTGEKECFKVEAHTGHSITATADHRHLVMRLDGSIENKSVSEIEVGDQIFLQMECGSLLNEHNLVPEVYELIDQIFSLNAIRRDQDEMYPDAIFCLGFITSADIETTLAGATHTTIKFKFRKQSANLSSYLLTTISRLQRVSHNFSLLADGSIQLRATNETIGTLNTLRRLLGPCPDAVLNWSPAHKTAYLGGVLAGLCCGIRQAVSVRLPDTDLSNFQLLMQTLGYVVKVTRAGKFGWITPFCSSSMELFQSIDKIKSAAFARPAPTAVTTANYERLVPVLTELYEKYGVDLPEQINERSPTQLLSLLVAIPTNRYKRDEYDWMRINLAMKILSSPLVPVTVTSIRSVGRKPTYDFETTNKHDHLMTINGVITHNSCIYGWAYGRGAAAIVLGARETGVEISQREAENLLRSLETTYPLAATYLQEASARVDEGYLVTPLGRIRRFPKSNDRKTIAGYRREAKNAPIQGGVADIVNQAAYNLRAYRKRLQMRFHIMLQMHDAFFFLCPVDEVVQLCNDVIPHAMCRDVPVIPYRLDGQLPPNQKPMYMGNNVSVSFAWKESMPKQEKIERLLDLGINPEHINRLEL